MIKICHNGHVTGYNHCSYCGAGSTPQAPPFTEFPAIRANRLERIARQQLAWANDPDAPTPEQERRTLQAERDEYARGQARKVKGIGAPRGTFSAVKNRMKNWLRGRRLAA